MPTGDDGSAGGRGCSFSELEVEEGGAAELTMRRMWSSDTPSSACAPKRASKQTCVLEGLLTSPVLSLSECTFMTFHSLWSKPARMRLRFHFLTVIRIFRGVS